MAKTLAVVVTLNMKPIASPAFTEAASAFLRIPILAGVQVIESLDSSLPSLVVVTLAVLSYLLHSVAEVVAVMCTEKLPPAARLVGPQESTCGALPAIEQSPAFDCASIDQVTPEPEPA